MPARKLGTALFVALLAMAAAIAAFLALGDLQAFLAVAKGVDAVPLAFALLATFCSYLAFCGALTASARAGGSEIRFFHVLPISFMSEALNNLLSTGGMGGLAIRVWAFGKRGIPAGVSVGMSVMTTVLGDAVVVLFLHIGVAFLLVRGKLETRAIASLAAVAVLFACALTIAWVVLRTPARRERLFGWIGRRAEKLATKAGQTGAALAAFRADFIGFFRTALSRPRRVAAAYAVVFCDLSLRCVVLGCAFWAVGEPLPPLVLLTGFSIGIVAGALSLVPGGIGVVESSMAAAFTLMGVELETAAAAVIVFRTAYYVVPLVAVPIFFRTVVSGSRPSSRPSTSTG